MRFLVVYCHPLETSFCHALYRTVAGALQQAGHEIRVIDLYGDGFQPVLTRRERTDYYATDHPYPQDIEKYIADLRWTQAIVFVYPTWWFGLPAMLKGWLDRVWLPQVAFSVTGNPRQPLQALLQNIELIAAVTTYGAPWWIVKWAGEPGRKTLFRGIKPLCRRRCRTLWLALYKMDVSTDASRGRFLSRVRRAFADIDRAAAGQS
jgi:putative NADPH-quinone reductase